MRESQKGVLKPCILKSYKVSIEYEPLG